MERQKPTYTHPGYATFGTEKAPIMGTVIQGYAILGAEKAPAGMGATIPYF